MSARKYAVNSEIISIKKYPENGDDVDEEYRCVEHDRAQCEDCLHKETYSNISNDPDVTGLNQDDLDCGQIIQDLNRLVSLATVAQKKLQHNKREITDYYSSALSEVKNFRKDINESLNKLEQELVRKISKFRDGDTTNVVIATGACDLLKLSVKNWLDVIQESKSEGNNDQLFVEMKTAECSMPNMTTEVNGYLENDLVTRYRVKRSESYLDSLINAELLSTRASTDKLKCKHLADIHIKSGDDDNECLVNGIAVLSENRVIVTDSGNKRLKLLDIKQNKIVAQIALSSKPFDLTIFKKDQIAVSLTAVKRLALFSVVQDMFTHPTYIELDRCLGIRNTGNMIVGVDQHPGIVKVYDINGKITRTFETDSNHEKLFEMPRYIALSPDGSVVYVTDWKNHSVICVTLTGELVADYRDDSLQRPYGVAVDEAGCVYVSSMDSHTVHQLSPTCHSGRVVLGREEGLSPCPGCLAYCSASGKLYTSSRSKASEFKNILQVFQLE